MICKTCNKPKKPNKRSAICSSCAGKLRFSKVKAKRSDFIIVKHKAGTRAAQDVYKYKAICKTCGTSRGYRFKHNLIGNCNKCSSKSKKPTPVNHNNAFCQIPACTPFQGQMTTRSSFEHFYAGYLNNNNIPFYYEIQVFKFKDGSSYLPDFYLPDTDEYVELKGQMDAVSKKKIETFRLEHPKKKLTVLRLKELQDLGYDINLYKKAYKVHILGVPWYIHVFSDKSYLKQHPGTEAVTISAENKICFSQSKACNLVTIFHELVHCFLAGNNISSTNNLQLEDFEEIVCETLAKNLMSILWLGFHIYRKNLKIVTSRYQEHLVPEMSYMQIWKLLKVFRNMKCSYTDEKTGEEVVSRGLFLSH